MTQQYINITISGCPFVQLFACFRMARVIGSDWNMGIESAFLCGLSRATTEMKEIRAELPVCKENFLLRKVQTEKYKLF